MVSAMGWEASSQAYQVQALPPIAILLQIAFQGHRQRPGALSRDQGDEQLPAFEVSCCAAVYVRYMKDTIGTVGAIVYHYKLQAQQSTATSGSQPVASHPPSPSEFPSSVLLAYLLRP